MPVSHDEDKTMSKTTRASYEDMVERDRQRMAHARREAERTAVKALLDEMEAEQHARMEARRAERRPGKR